MNIDRGKSVFQIIDGLGSINLNVTVTVLVAQRFGIDLDDISSTNRSCLLRILQSNHNTSHGSRSVAEVSVFLAGYFRLL
jgi:hypothetical protein